MPASPATDADWDAIAIGSGIGGLTAAALLARYGWRVLVCESHTIPGGAAHGFSRQGFRFDSGPSFFCGLGNPDSGDPLRQVLAALGETVATVPYDPLGHYHFPEGVLPVWNDPDRYREAIAAFSPQGARELAGFEAELRSLHRALRGIPPLALRADWRALPELLGRYPWQLLALLPHLGLTRSSVGAVLDRRVRDPWVRRLVDLECFLLSGLQAAGTIAPEFAYVLGERATAATDYPKGGSEAIVAALVRGLERWGGRLRLGAHVERILTDGGTGKRAVRGVRLRGGEELRARTVLSNASIWDTYGSLLPPEAVSAGVREIASLEENRRAALETPAIDSFMHLHLGFRAAGLEGLTGHHVVLHDGDRDLASPGNVCMISIPSVWDRDLAPSGHHVAHVYSLEPFDPWVGLVPEASPLEIRRSAAYADRKRVRAAPLYRALERVVPDLRDRLALELVGTPLTHARFLRRHRGTYGPAIAADRGLFPSCHTAIAGLYRVGDSTLPGIGVPAAAASGILCANTLVDPARSAELL